MIFFLKNYCKSFLLFFTFALMINTTLIAVAAHFTNDCDTYITESFSLNNSFLSLEQLLNTDVYLSIIYANMRV